MINDLDVVRSFKSGNKDAYIELYDKYLKKIYNFIYFKTSHKETAEDLTSLTFIKALKQLESFKEVEKASFSAWLFTIARNNVCDHYRSARDSQDIDDVWDLASDETILRDIEFKEKTDVLSKYLRKLSSKQRDIIILRIFQDLSYREIAEISEKSEAACKMEFSRALKTLKEIMPKEAIVSLIVLALNIAKIK